MINPYNFLNLTKLDVLDGFKEVRVATSYNIEGRELKILPAGLNVMAGMEIEYKTFGGWIREMTGSRKFEILPQKVKEYVCYIEEQVGVPIKWIGTGPRREDVITK